MVKKYAKNSRVALANNFVASEFSCKGKGCCSETCVDTDLVANVQKIRDHFGASVTISSGYRCPKHNKSVGGATGSYHTKGMAADLIVKGVAPAEVAKYAESIGVKGIGLYETTTDGYFVHIDTRTSKSFWYGQKQAGRSTFGGAPVADKPTAPRVSIREWQNAAVLDGYRFPKYGCDGAWGKESEAVAKSALCRKPTVSFVYKNKNLTKIVQKAMGMTGPDVDGKFGNGTRDAVIAFQKANGLAADGIVGFGTWKKILGVK